MDAKDKKIEELEAELSLYKENPAAEFYLALTEGVKHLTSEIKNKTLDLKEDGFADSILKLSEKADKIFISLEKGLETFQQKQDEDSAMKKKIVKAKGVAV